MIGIRCQAILRFSVRSIVLSDGTGTFLTGSTDCCKRLAVQEYILSQVMDLGCQKAERKDLAKMQKDIQEHIILWPFFLLQPYQKNNPFLWNIYLLKATYLQYF